MHPIHHAMSYNTRIMSENLQQCFRVSAAEVYSSKVNITNNKLMVVCSTRHYFLLLNVHGRRRLSGQRVEAGGDVFKCDSNWEVVLPDPRHNMVVELITTSSPRDTRI
jgi:hypothetical protein